jgi:hypothetical protein
MRRKYRAKARPITVKGEKIAAVTVQVARFSSGDKLVEEIEKDRDHHRVNDVHHEAHLVAGLDLEIPTNEG